MSKSRDNRHRRQKAARKMLAWRKAHRPLQRISVPIEIVSVQGTLPVRAG